MLNRVLTVVSVIGLVTSVLAYIVVRNEAFIDRAMFCALACWLSIVDDRQGFDRDRIDDLEDAHSRRWEP